VARQNQILAALNRGEVSLLAMARSDIEHLRLSAQSQINYLPRVLGPMMLRPGTQYVGGIYNNAPTKIIPFVAAFADTALIELTANLMRIWIDDALVTRAAVATTIPAFGSWSITTTGTATSSTSGGLSFSGMNNGATANASVAMSVAPGDLNTEHALRIVVANGPINFAIGTTAGLDDVFPVAKLDTGTYSLAFTPGATTVYPQFSATISVQNANTNAQSLPTWAQQVKVTSIAIEAAGVFTLPAPWGADAIGSPSVTPSLIRSTQSGDFVYVACTGYPQYQINRYTPTSWSIVKYRPIKGPMTCAPSNASLTLQPSALYGNVTLTASGGLFTVDDVGTLFRLFHTGQYINETVSFDGTFTDALRVSGVSYVSTVDGSGNVKNTATADRNFTFTISGTWTGTISVQRSFTSATTGFSTYKTYTSNQSDTITDGLNNEIVWYQIGFEPGNYVSGSAVIVINYGGGGNYGVCHITSITSATVANAEVLVPFWGTDKTHDWLQSEWSAGQGYPTATTLHQGRLWWSGADKFWGSISDDYTNFDYDATGDAAPLDTAVGQGPIANINWMVSIDHMLAGADTSILAAMSDAIESPLTPSNFILRRSVTNGAYGLQAVAVDQRVVYLDQSGRRLYDLVYDIRIYNYKPSDLTRLNPDIGLPGFVDMAVQRQPDTRINMIRTDGIMASLIYDIDDDVIAWWRMQTDGVIEGIAILPGFREDQVYFVINRVIQGQHVRYLEKWARVDECQGAAISKCVDANLVYQGAPATILSGFNHLIGKTVAIWGDGGAGHFGDLGTAVVQSNGTVTIPNGVAVIAAVAGLPYQAEFISAKLAYAAQMGSAINQVKRLDHCGLVLTNTWWKGVRYGTWTPNDPDNQPNGIFTPNGKLDDLPEVEYGALVADGTVWAQYDSKQFEIGSDHDTDPRLYLQSASPNPATINGVTFSIESTN